ncbi:MAG TPA: NADH-quinone oxidoreductase subunit NuoF [Opitutaceae bacterium]
MEKPLTQHTDPRNPPDFAAYEATGGYEAFRSSLRDQEPTAITKLIQNSGLKGRGGAGFLTGLKWSFVPMGADARHPKFLVCNADEMEPGTFKDRFLIEGNPHQLLEGILLASYAIQADVAYIFLRAEYALCAKRLAGAIAEARQHGMIGDNILGTGWKLEVHLHASAGRYICGEETALLNALEGKRALPRTKPPFPPVVGLWGKPTVVNNVETLCNIPHIVRNGTEWFNSLSRSDDGGTKLFGASGRVNRPGLWELPMGVPLREIIEEHAGGMRPGYRFRGVIPGGASTDFLVEEHLDIPMDFASVAKAGSRLGTGTMVVLDDKTCPVGMVLNLETFFARESCGWCTPCREGLPWVEKILRAFEEGDAIEDDIALLRHHARMLGPGRTFCAFAPGAVEPLQSALRYFEDDFRRHLGGGCPFDDTASRRRPTVHA